MIQAFVSNIVVPVAVVPVDAVATQTIAWEVKEILILEQQYVGRAMTSFSYDITPTRGNCFQTK